MGSTSYQEASEQSFLVTVESGLVSFQTRASYSPLAAEGRSQKELAVESLKTLITKLETEIAAGNL
jgi:hypothetical protein